jgi:hypothetical protein
MSVEELNYADRLELKSSSRGNLKYHGNYSEIVVPKKLALENDYHPDDFL